MTDQPPALPDLAEMVRLAKQAAATFAVRIRMHPATLAALREHLASDQRLAVQPRWTAPAFGVDVVEDTDVDPGAFVLDYADGHSALYPEWPPLERAPTHGQE